MKTATLNLGDWIKGKIGSMPTPNLDPVDRSKLLAFISASDLSTFFHWSELFKVYPISDSKVRLINKNKNRSQAMGIFVDHLCKIASKLVSSVYAKRLQELRRNSRIIQRQRKKPYMRSIDSEVIIETRILLKAVYDKIKNGKGD